MVGQSREQETRAWRRSVPRQISHTNIGPGSPLRTLTRRRVDKVKLLYKHVDVITDKDMYHFAQLRFEFYYAENIFCGWKKKCQK